jgi:hypothetical protein
MYAALGSVLGTGGKKAMKEEKRNKNMGQKGNK